MGTIVFQYERFTHIRIFAQVHATDHTSQVSDAYVQHPSTFQQMNLCPKLPGIHVDHFSVELQKGSTAVWREAQYQ